jgi:hypothetical protein
MPLRAGSSPQWKKRLVLLCITACALILVSGTNIGGQGVLRGTGQGVANPESSVLSKDQTGHETPASHNTPGISLTSEKSKLTSFPGCPVVRQAESRCPGIRELGSPKFVNSGSEGWLSLHPAASPPLNASAYDESVYDGVDNSTVLFHSLCSSGPCLTPTTWLFNGTNWTLLRSGNPTGPMGEPSLAYDSGDRYVVLYGENSTWKFSSGNWTNITQGTSPGPLEGAALSYDAFDKYVLLFGGLGFNSTGTWISNETWTFSNGNWTRITTSGEPPPNYGPYLPDPMVYDPALESVVLFEDTNWTYLYQAGSWQAVYAPIPASLEAGGGPIVYDSQSGDVICVGGYEGGAYTNQTWAFNGTGWAQLHPTKAPPAAFDPVLVSDARDRDLLFFGGGTSGGGVNNQTWIFGAANVTFTAVPAGGGNFNLGGTVYQGGKSAWVPYGVYLPKLVPNPGFHGINFSATGNLTPFNGSYRLSGNANIVGQFAAFPRVTLATLPASCEVDFNNTLYSSGSSAPFVPGTYSLIAPACPYLVFKNWLPGENASVLDVYDNRTTVTLSGPSTLTADFLATVNFEVNPSFSGTIFFNGTPQVPNSPQDWPTQNYSLEELAAPGWRFVTFSASGGIQLASGSAEVEASGVISANFVQFPTVTLETSLSSCPSVEFNGSTYALGSEPRFLLGNYSVGASACSDALFEHWSTSGGVMVASPNSVNTTANVTGNGTLTADYGHAAWVNLTDQPSAAAGSVTWNGTAVRNGTSFEALTGDYVATARPANGWHFLDWKTQGGLVLGAGSFALSSNASLTAVFQINATTPGGNQSGTNGFGLAIWEWVALGVGVIGALAVAVVLFRRRRTVDGTPEDRDNP